MSSILLSSCVAVTRCDGRTLSWIKISRSDSSLTSSYCRCFVAHGPRLVVSLAAEDEQSALAVRRGFGTPKKAGAKGDSSKNASGTNVEKSSGGGGSKKLNRMVDVIDAKSSGKRNSARGINSAEAKSGRVDFVRVENWGEDEESGKLENLRVKSFSPAATSARTSGPFYEKLVNRLQLLESKGELAVARMNPLPSFDRWVFGENRYMQFLVDQRAIFGAIRDVIDDIKAQGDAYLDDRGASRPSQTFRKAVSLFSEELGLDRCKTLDADIDLLYKSLKAKGRALGPLEATTQTASHARYLRQIGSASLENSEKAKDSFLKFLAHIFTTYVSHLTTGMRIGAKAMDNVDVVRETSAVSFYRDYPLEGQDPLKLFIQTVNSAGDLISSEENHEQVMEELPRAMQKTSLLLSVLAVEEQVPVK